MESTGSTLSKVDKDKNQITIPQDHYKFFPSIIERGLGEKTNRKKLYELFNKYLRPLQNDRKTIDI